MNAELMTVAYIGATILFILSLGGLSNPETSRRGNLFGIIGMSIAVIATLMGPRITGVSSFASILIAMTVGGSVGIFAAIRVKMTQMPELVALMHSLVGLAACLVGFANFIDPSSHFTGSEKTIHEIEIYVGILIGAITFSGSLVAFGKLSGKIGGQPLLLPARHLLNLGLLVTVIIAGRSFLDAGSIEQGLVPLYLMTVIALLFGIHMVIAIGGADMPVVVSMLNSYSGWAASATGFMLSNDLLIVV
ncbi:MAG TPA: Re/Si-specific NAD(P)(+) transhydrogenase subunit beta, partial [Magnetococcales bacterium]|nr:Re/Si-specific NAD(P)(+) transhydrogenase subunit beta [Magnetococcales bacterium]